MNSKSKDKIQIQCENCGRGILLKNDIFEKHTGSKFRCPFCKGVFFIPEILEVEEDEDDTQEIMFDELKTSMLKGEVMPYEYKMIQLPPNVEVGTGQKHTGAARYLENVVNEMAEDEWEFYRIDSIGVTERPGCLGALFGAKQEIVLYYVITFRRIYKE